MLGLLQVSGKTMKYSPETRLIYLFLQVKYFVERIPGMDNQG